MSLKSRVEQIAAEAAKEIARGQTEARMRQMETSLSSMAEVTRVDGTNITLRLSDGTERTVTNIGDRIVRPGDPMVTDNKNAAI